MKHELLKSPGWLGLSMNRQMLIKSFFGVCATATIAVLFLIVWSLMREGVGFIPTYRWELSVYRKSGLEYVDYLQKPISQHEAIYSKLNRSLQAELNTVVRESRDRRNAAYQLKSQIEAKTKSQRQAFTQALKQADVPGSEATIESLREELRQANLLAASELTLSYGQFNPKEERLLIQQLTEWSPEDRNLPAFLQDLISEATIKEQQAKAQFQPLIEVVNRFEEAPEALQDLVHELRQLVVATKTDATLQHLSEAAKTSLLKAAEDAKSPELKQKFLNDAAATETTSIDFATRVQPVLAKQLEIESLLLPFIAELKSLAALIPQEATTKEAQTLLQSASKSLPHLIESLDKTITLTRQWQWDKPVPMIQAMTAFLFGGDWITNSSWQDFYGVIPLLTGSLLISLTALVIAVPISVAAAIYVNQFAGQKEQDLIKPVIEFIQAIPSVVLGFIGIAVLGDLIKSTSEISWLQWIPGFPVQERLNMMNAGCLLALMAIPTIFSLAEDAINNVPSAFSEASEALGSTKLQTVFRVILPASLSGIFAAILLGLGRIIGETMVVLLVAGNRIAIPNFSDGIGTIFQPAHTLTGIIAQELGEVSRGSSHWQALFMVGILLFFISLAINWGSRHVVRKFQIRKI